jgi:long-chain acyl-CoA synthetase
MVFGSSQTTPLAALLDHAAKNPDGLAFIDGRGRWTYARLAADVERLARGLVGRRIRKGDRIVLHMPNRAELAVSLYACFHVGAIAVPMNTRLKAAEIKPLLQRLQPALYFGHADFYDEVQAVDASILPPDRRFIVGHLKREHRAEPWDTLLCDSGSVPLVSDVGSAAVLLTTSGTTGLPKFVVHTSATLDGATDLMAGFGFQASRTAVVFCPMVHASGLFTFLACIRYGVNMILFERFDPAAVLDTIETQQCDFMVGLPFMYDALLKSQQTTPRKIASLRLCFVSGDVCPLQIQRQFLVSFGVVLRSVWAASEAMGSLTYGLESGPVSRVMKGAEARLVDLSGLPVASGEIGELLVRGPNVSIGYWVGPGAIEDAPEDGWWRSGDMMRQDEKRNLWFVSRKKDLIVRGGSNVSPVEIERILAAHPAVADAAVVGLPDDVLGQRVAGFVQLKDGIAADVVNDILKAARSQLADYKAPEYLAAIAAIPRNALGKTDRKAVAGMLVEQRRTADCSAVLAHGHNCNANSNAEIEA